MKSLSMPLAISLMMICLICGIMIGYALTPYYLNDPTGASHSSLGEADRFVDQRYLRAMIAHHRGAMLLAEQAKQHSDRQEIQQLAEEILVNEPKLIAELQAWNSQWYGDFRPVIDPPPVNLGTAGKTFDLRFLNALIAHHQEGIKMTKEIRAKSTRAEILDNADAVETFLSKSGNQLALWRAQWYAVNQPASSTDATVSGVTNTRSLAWGVGL